MAIHIKDVDDLKNRLAEAGEKLVVIDFMANWCGPCKMIGPKLEELANEMADSLVVLKVTNTHWKIFVLHVSVYTFLDIFDFLIFLRHTITKFKIFEGLKVIVIIDGVYLLNYTITEELR